VSDGEIRLLAPDSMVVQVAAELLLAHVRGPEKVCVRCAQPAPCATATHARLVCQAAGLKSRIPQPHA
jgi:hypothetical protein